MSLNPLFSVMLNLPSNLREHYNLPKPQEHPDVLNDNIITPDQVQHIYMDMVVNARIAHQTPLSDAFLSPRNIEYIRQQIEIQLQHYLKEQVGFLLTREFSSNIIDVLLGHDRYNNEPQMIIPYLNSLIIKQELELALISQNQQKRYEKWGLRNDRMKVIDYGLGDKTLHAKGENQVNPSGYNLQHPHKNRYQQYLKEVMNIKSK